MVQISKKKTPPFTQRNIEKSDWKGFFSTKKSDRVPPGILPL